MTNEQIYLFLMYFSDCLEHELESLRLQLPEGMEREPEWWRGDRQVSSFEALAAMMGAPNYEREPTGDFVALVGLADFLEKLKARAGSLLTGGSHENSDLDL